MELKGLITQGDRVSLTCCEGLMDINIGGVSLYNELDGLFGLDPEEYWCNSEKEMPTYAVRYVTLDEEPDSEKSFEQLSAEVVMNMLYGSHVYGCYSEWTCGYGSFDYVIGKDGEGHSIFNELQSHIGKYIHFKI